MANVLVAGCGDVGTALALRLAGTGHSVWGLRRRADALPAPIRPVAADLGEPTSLAGLPADLDVVVYAAAAGAFSGTAYRAAYVDGVANLLQATGRVGRFLFVSSTGVYGQRGGEWVDEASPTQPVGFSGRCLLQGEALVAGAGCTGIVVRLGGIYGPGRLRLVNRVRDGAPCACRPPRYTNRIHRDDCAGVLAHLAFKEQPGDLYVGVDDEPAQECVVMDWIADRLGVARPPREDGSPPGSRTQANKRCRNDRLREAGYRFRYPTFREGYGAVLDGLDGVD
jgi:nucleoside-diphosphate-sugar epimerase